MEAVSGIYKITCHADGKFYIGSSKNCRVRWYDHRGRLRRNAHGNCHLQRAWNKYGEDAFSIELVEQCSVDKLNELEYRYIDETDARNKGFNLLDRVAILRDFSLTVDQRAKISAALKGRMRSESHCSNISKALKGKKPSDDTKKRMSEAHKERWKTFKPTLTPEMRERISAAQRGKKLSDETKKKIAQAMKTRFFTTDHKAHMSLSQRRRLRQKSLVTCVVGFGFRWGTAS